MMGFEFSSITPVISNTNKQDVISAVILGDTSKSRILPRKSSKSSFKPIEPLVSKNITEHKQAVTSKEANVVHAKDKAIALTISQKNKLLQENLQENLQEKSHEMKKIAKAMQQELFAKDLLSDIKQEQTRQKQHQQKQVKSQFEKTLQQQAEKSLRQQLLNEEIKLQGTEQRLSRGEINKYKALILQSISEHWIIPSGANKSLYCELMIRLAPDGTVLEVHITKTSGDPSLDGSARAAVLKSSPLPVPSDTAAFSAFRQFALKVKPENILNRD
jgi:colicin import membrane protein